MNYILIDTNNWENLLPLTFTKPVSELRVGILTIKEKWERYLNTKISSYLTNSYLNQKFKLIIEDENILINSSVLPNSELIHKIKNLDFNETISDGEDIIAIKLRNFDINNFILSNLNDSGKIITNIQSKIQYPWDIFTKNAREIEADFKLLTNNRKSQILSSTNRFVNPENIFVEEGAKVEFSILNPDKGYIYIAKDAEIMEGSIIRGSMALCEHSTIKMGAKIYGATTIGPHSKVGGEVNNSVITGYSSKAHDGFLGNSVLGEWCNLGADTNNSNLKNNYAEVKVWNYHHQKFIKTNLQFCGLIMGDHSKSGINTMFNTGTVVGVSANIFGSGFPRNFIPSFSWGGASGFQEYALNKVFETAELVMNRRNIKLDEIEKNILKSVFEITSKYRNF